MSAAYAISRASAIGECAKIALEVAEAVMKAAPTAEAKIAAWANVEPIILALNGMQAGAVTAARDAVKQEAGL